MNHIDLKNKTIFVTGSAGFIGSNLVLELLRTQSPINIIGLDNMNDYYDVNIKEWRLQEIKKCVSEHSDSTYVFYKDDLADKTVIDKIFAEHKPDIVVNLGAQAGVRYSITNPDAYIQSNMIGFYNILEACRHSYDNGCKGVDHLVYASSSSVYGTNKKVPYSTEDKVDNPVSLYAATKKSNELMAHAYSKLYNIPSTGLRFFTVYGPAGRPDMAYFGFTNKLIKVSLSKYSLHRLITAARRMISGRVPSPIHSFVLPLFFHLKLHSISSIYLCKAAKSRFCRMAHALFWSHEHHIPHQLRPWSHYRHRSS